MYLWFLLVPALVSGVAATAQETPPGEPAPGEGSGWRKVEAAPDAVVVETGTRIPLNLINSISTKQSSEGDRVYLETAFPILVKNQVVIPPGSYVAGTVTFLKKPGRVKGRGELFLRFDSLTLPNGVTRDFRARVGGLDGRGGEELDRSEGKIKSEGNKSGDARTVGEATAAGTSVGVIAGSAAGRAGMGAGIGAAAGATAGLLGVLLSRGPDIVLSKGSTVEMVLDRPLEFSPSELDFTNGMKRVSVDGPGPQQLDRRDSRVPMPGRRFPGRIP